MSFFNSYVAPKRKSNAMKIGCARDSNGDIGIAAGKLFNPDFIVATATTGTIAAVDATWRDLFSTKEQVISLKPYTTGSFGNVLIKNSLSTLDLTPYGDIFTADSLDVAPSGTSFVSSYDLFTVSDGVSLLEKTVSLAASRGKKSATFPLTNPEIYIWADLMDSGQTARAQGFINLFMDTSTIKTTLLAAASVSALPADYQLYISHYRAKVAAILASNVDYINFGLSAFTLDSQLTELAFFCQYWQRLFGKSLVSFGGGTFIIGNLGAVARSKEICQILKDNGFKYIRGSLNTSSGVQGWGTSSGGLTGLGQLVKEFKESQ